VKEEMKHFSIKMLLIGVFLPPLCYITTMQALETYFQRQEAARLDQILVQIRNNEALYEGRYTVKEELNRKIEEYLSQGLEFRLGVSPHILVKTTDDRMLYPSQFQVDEKPDDFSGVPVEDLSSAQVGAENYNILNQGLVPSVHVDVKQNSWLSNGILVFYIFLYLLMGYRVIGRHIRKTRLQEKGQDRVIERLCVQLDKAENGLREIKLREVDYLERISRLKKERENLSEDIDELLDEMQDLEAGLKTHGKLKENMKSEVLELREDLDRLRGKIAKPATKEKESNTVQKRFKVLYKKLFFTDRAIEGFLSLTGEFRLKAEEVIHRLNEDASRVSVKRKVFSRGGKAQILETKFSYSGRIYFQRGPQLKTVIVVIGTKNTQEHDLAYIERNPARNG
jgi:hypothetical protein